MQSKAASVKAYLAELSPERRGAIEAVRAVILKNLDKGFEEGMQYGMIAYFVPHRLFPAGYHCDPSKPLCYAALASQKQYMSLYLMSIYGSSDHARWFREAWAKTGKPLDSGKSCIRFKRVEDLALEVVGEAIARVSAKKYIEIYQRGRAAAEEKSVERKAASRRPSVKGTAKRAANAPAVKKASGRRGPGNGARAKVSR